jgi:hypothetical protein
VAENPRALRRDVDEAREQLGETLEALAHKAKRPGRAAAKARAGARPSRLAAAAVALGGAVTLRRVRRRRR